MGGPNFTRKIPEGDTHERSVCVDCDYIQYDNPKIISGVVPLWQDKVLLCIRAIAPRVGFWTVPAGFLELGEGPDEGAGREAAEEANADVDVGDLIGVYTLREFGQVQMFYRGTLRSPEVSPGIESQRVELFEWQDIPWSELAFPQIEWALRDYEKNLGRQTAVPTSRTV